MEADGSSDGTCGYCNRVGHRTEECREQSNDRRLEVAFGCLIGLILVPFAVIGYIAGIAAGALWGGLSVGFRYFGEWVKDMKRLFRIK